MSLGIHPVFDRRLSGTKFTALGEALAANYQALDQIANCARLTLFTSFADNRPVPANFCGDPDELREIMGDWDEWFDATAGRIAMRSLADQIMSSAESANLLCNANNVVAELEELARVLTAAEAQGIRFRLEMI